VTSVGYAGGHTPDPDYNKTCTGTTGHAEMVHMVYDPKVITFDEILKVFFENHDPTQGNRQGNDRGPQYRSVRKAIACTAQQGLCVTCRRARHRTLKKRYHLCEHKPALWFRSQANLNQYRDNARGLS